METKILMPLAGRSRVDESRCHTGLHRPLQPRWHLFTSQNNSDRLIIADASGLVSIAITTDTNHQRAIAAATDLADKQSVVIIPSEIFAETINILGKKFGHARALQTAQTLLDSSDFLVIDTEEATRLDALRLFANTATGVSFTDCLVMATADKYETREIFGFDGIFSKKGYHVPVQLKRAA